MSEPQTILPIFFHSLRTGVFQSRLGTAQAINPQRHIVMTGLPGLLRELWTFGVNGANHQTTPVFLNYDSGVITVLAALAMKLIVRRTRLVSIGRPPCGMARWFDVIATLPHERIRGQSENYITIKTVPDADSRRTEFSPSRGVNDNVPRGKKQIVIMVGGDIPAGRRMQRFTEQHAHAFIEKILKLTESVDCDLLLTTSRRTPIVVEMALKRYAHHFKEMYLWNLDASDPDKKNPIESFMSRANMVVVTADSKSMMSRAAQSGLPVYGFSPQGLLPEEHKAFYDSLLDGGHVRNLNDTPLNFNKMNPLPDPGRQIAEALRQVINPSLG